MGGIDEREFQRRVKYTALRSQSRFHRTKKRFKGFSGPVGSGKSAALCFEALRAAYRNQGRTGLIGAPTYNMLRDATLPSFLEMVEENGFPYQLNRSTFTVTFPEVGSKVLFRSLDEYERLRGSNLAWFGIDELTYCAEEAWTRLEARLRDPKATVLSGFAVWTPKGFDWVYRRFLGEPVAGYGLVEAKPFENRYLLEKTPDFYERLKASYDERFYEQEALGSYRNLQAGQVYYAFDSTGGVGDFEVEPSAEILWSWDFNVNPMASVIAQRRGDRVCVIDEIYLTTSSTEEVCEEFLGRYGDHRGGVRVYGDATGERRYSVSSFSDYALIRRFLKAHPELKGVVDVGKANPPVRDRVNLVNSKLAGADGERRLLVGRRCRKVIQDLEQVCYKPDSGVIDKDRDSARTHLSDALGYLVWMEFKSVGKVGERSGRLV